MDKDLCAKKSASFLSRGAGLTHICIFVMAVNETVAFFLNEKLHSTAVAHDKRNDDEEQFNANLRIDSSN